MRPFRPNPNPDKLSRYAADAATQKANRTRLRATHVKQETAAERRARKRAEAEERNGELSHVE